MRLIFHIKRGCNMFNKVNEWIGEIIYNFFADLLSGIIDYFFDILVDIMSLAGYTLTIPLVKAGIKYAQTLAFSILVLKTMFEAFQTYILHDAGDPDADPGGLLIRTVQSVAIIATLPFILSHLSHFGTRINTDVSNLDGGKMSEVDVKAIFAIGGASLGLVPILVMLIFVIMILIIAIQTTIRGAELALMAVIGPILALNITSNNRQYWSNWFWRVVVICVSQGLQLFLYSVAVDSMVKGFDNGSVIFLFGWIWVTIKMPKMIQQFVYSSGFSGAAGGAGKQMGMMVLSKVIMKK
jgi:hypothetical protein